MLEALDGYVVAPKHLRELGLRQALGVVHGDVHGEQVAYRHTQRAFTHTGCPVADVLLCSGDLRGLCQVVGDVHVEHLHEVVQFAVAGSKAEALGVAHGQLLHAGFCFVLDAGTRCVLVVGVGHQEPGEGADFSIQQRQLLSDLWPDRPQRHELWRGDVESPVALFDADHIEVVGEEDVVGVVRALFHIGAHCADVADGRADFVLELVEQLAVLLGIAEAELLVYEEQRALQVGVELFFEVVEALLGGVGVTNDGAQDTLEENAFAGAGAPAENPRGLRLLAGLHGVRQPVHKPFELGVGVATDVEQHAVDKRAQIA